GGRSSVAHPESLRTGAPLRSAGHSKHPGRAREHRELPTRATTGRSHTARPDRPIKHRCGRSESFAKISSSECSSPLARAAFAPLGPNRFTCWGFSLSLVSQLLERARGALLGLAVGDALGTTHEFRHLSPAPFQRLATGPHVDVLGGGPFRVQPGQVTDDTMMATALASSLQGLRGCDASDVARPYVDWKQVTFDCGWQTGAALNLVAHGVPPEKSGRQVWLAEGRRRLAMAV